MEKLASAIRPLTIILTVALVFSVAVLAQQPMPGSLQGPHIQGGPGLQQDTPNLPPLVFKGENPSPEPAQQAILNLFHKYEVVGMSVDHGEKDLDDFILTLIRNPEFPSKVNDIAVECGNSLYQPMLDRYIAGEDIPLTEIRHAWSDTTNPQCGLSAFYEEFFPLVRRINKNLPPEKKLRVLAGDPPVDWSKAKSMRDVMAPRDESIASVMEKEVLSKHRKALMLFGEIHLLHGHFAVGLYEKNYPNVTYVIADYSVFGISGKNREELEKRLAAWPVPSLATVKGTWLNVDPSYFIPMPPMRGGPGGQSGSAQPPQKLKFSDVADGFLYLGPADLLLWEHVPANIVMDKDFMAELDQKRAILDAGGGSSPIDHLLGREKTNSELYGDAISALGAMRGPSGSPGGPQQHHAGPGEAPPPSSGQQSGQPPMQQPPNP